MPPVAHGFRAHSRASRGTCSREYHADVCIIGAGASGLMCAQCAARRGRRVMLVDKATTPGRKICISGGGKANFTNKNMRAEHFVCTDADFCQPALDAFTPQQILEFLAAYNLPWEEREHQQLFGLRNAGELVDALVQECAKYHCRFFLETHNTSISHTKTGFSITADTNHIHTHSLVLATGSPAWAACGATDQGSIWARQLGHSTRPFSPVLVPFIMPDAWPLHGLAGISLPVTMYTGSYSCTDNILFTHSGCSGPVVLQTSCHWQTGQEVIIDFLPHLSFADLLDAPECGKLFARSLLARHIPQRLADALLPTDLARRKIAELSRKSRTELHNAIHAHTCIPQSTAGLTRAEAAQGGVCIGEINAYSMESLIVPQLFITGELLDVTGQLGGYNLHWAWASGFLAGQYV